jgi:hypothetical protein
MKEHSYINNKERIKKALLSIQRIQNTIERRGYLFRESMDDLLMLARCVHEIVFTLEGEENELNSK